MYKYIILVVGRNDFIRSENSTREKEKGVTAKKVG